MVKYDFQQGDPGWFELHRGVITGSVIKTVMHGGRKAWNTLLDKKQAELEGADMINNIDHVPAIKYGRELEPQAIAQYELIHNIDVERPVFIYHPDYDHIGCSPDFMHSDLVGEIKCPYNKDNHQLTILYGKLANDYKPQIQLEIECSRKDGAHFLSYDPRYFDHTQRLFIMDIERDNDYIDNMLDKCHKFNQMLKAGDRFDDKPSDIPKLF